MKPDIITIWPRSCDYPLFRDFIKKERNRFNGVIIVLTETHFGENYSTFLKDVLKEDATVVDSPTAYGTQDWRSVATNEGLRHSNSEWVWFLEQDFFPKVGFFTDINMWWKNYPIKSFQIKEGGRLHPACLFVMRAVIDKTSKDFGIVPDKHDHFYKFFKEINYYLDVDERKIIDKRLYYHMAGLSHNMNLVYSGQQPNHEKKLFNDYINRSLQLDIPINAHFKDVFTNYIQTISA